MKTLLCVSFLVTALTTPAAFSLQDQVYTTSFDDSSGRPVVNLMINGQGPYPFIFDTGAPGITVRPELAEELGLEVTGQGEIGSPIGEGGIAVDLTELTSLSLGGAEVDDVSAMIVAIGAPGQLSAMGVLGPRLFTDFGRVSYNFSNDTIEIGGSAEPLPEDAWLPIDAGSFLLNVNLTFGEAQIDFHLDTGNPSVVIFPYQHASELPLEGEPRVVGQARTVDRSFDIYSAPIATNLEFSDAVIHLTNAMMFEAPFGNIGSGALQGMTLEIDWSQDRFALSDGE